MQMDNLPIPALCLLTIVLVIASIELGHRMGRRALQKSEDEKEAPVSNIAGAILGLAAFMLAFTFSIVADRYDSRRALVRDDAIAIRTAWQRSEFLPEPDRAVADRMLRQYVDRRIDFAETQSLDPARLRAFLSATQALQDSLWEMAVVNARKDMNSDVAALYIDALNLVNGVHATRVAVGVQARIPQEIWVVLYCTTIISMVAIGYHTGVAGSRRSNARLFLALSFALVFALIASLDRPDSGVLVVTQQPLIDLRQIMAAPHGTAAMKNLP